MDSPFPRTRPPIADNGGVPHRAEIIAVASFGGDPEKLKVILPLGQPEKMLAEVSTKPNFQLLDRKSTRLNSSHQIISYAVFCLKKKKLATRARYDGTPPRQQ